MPQLDFSYYGVTICWSVLKLLFFVCFFELSVIVFLGRSLHHISFVLFKNNLNLLSNYFEKQFYVYFILFRYSANLKYYQEFFSYFLINNFLYLFFKNLFNNFFFNVYFNAFLFLNIEKKKIFKNKNLYSFLFLLDLPYDGQMSFQDPATPIMEGIILFHHELLIIQIFIGIFVFWMLLRTVMLFRLKIFKLNKVMGNFFSPEYFYVKKDNMWDEKAKFIPALCDWFRFIFIVYGFNAIWDMDKKQLSYYKELGLNLVNQTLNYLKLNFLYGFFLYILKYRIVTFFEFFNTESEKKETLKLLQNYWFFTYLLFDLRHKSSYKQSLYYINYINNFNDAFSINVERESLSSKDILGYENRVPSKVRHHTLLESVWTIIPSLILIVIAIPSFALLYAMDELVAPAMTVHVMGNQWYWRYTYTLFRANNFSYYFNTVNNFGINTPELYSKFNILKDNQINSFSLFELNNSNDLVLETMLSDNTLSLKYWPVLRRPDTFKFLDFKSAIFFANEQEMDLTGRKWYFYDSYLQLSYITLLAYLDNFNYCERLSIYLYLDYLCSYPINGLSYYSNKELIYIFGEFMTYVMNETFKIVLLYDYYLDLLNTDFLNNIKNPLHKYLELFYISDVNELNCLRYVYILLGQEALKFYSLVYPFKDFEKSFFNSLSATILNLLYLRVTDGFTFDEFILMRKVGSNTLNFDDNKGLLLLNDFYANEVSLLTNYIGDFSGKTLNDLLHYVILKANYFAVYFPYVQYQYFNLNSEKFLNTEFLNKYVYVYLFNSLKNDFDVVLKDISSNLFLNKKLNSGLLNDIFYSSSTFFNTVDKTLVQGNFFNYCLKSYETSFKGIFSLLKSSNFLTLCSFERDLKVGLKNFIKVSFPTFYTLRFDSAAHKYFNFLSNYRTWELYNYLCLYLLSDLDELSYIEKFKGQFSTNYFESSVLDLIYKMYLKTFFIFETGVYSKGFKLEAFYFTGYPDIFSVRKALWFVDEYVEFMDNLISSFNKSLDEELLLKNMFKFYGYSYIFGNCQLYHHAFESLYSFFFEDYTGFYWFYYKIPFGNLMEFDGKNMNYTTMCLQWYFLCWPFEENSWSNFFNKCFMEKIRYDFSPLTTVFNNNKNGYNLLTLFLFDKNTKGGLKWLFSLNNVNDSSQKRYFYNWNFLNCLTQKPIEFEDYISRKGRITFESRLKGNLDKSYFVLPNKLGMYRLLDVDNMLILPERISIRLLITSSDVLHSWAVPSLGIKLDACPGRLNQTSVYLKRIGTFYGQCSEICGINHAFMPIVVKSIPLTSYTYMRLVCFNKAFLNIFKKIDLPLFNIGNFKY